MCLMLYLRYLSFSCVPHCTNMSTRFYVYILGHVVFFFFFLFFFLDHVYSFFSLSFSFAFSSQVMLWLLVIISDLADVSRAVTSTRSCNYRGASLTPFICFSYPPSRKKERPRERERSNMNE